VQGDKSRRFSDGSRECAVDSGWNARGGQRRGRDEKTTVAKFIFRAQVALDLRRKQEDAARLALAEAQSRLQLAEWELHGAQTRLTEAMTRARDTEAEAADPTLAIWYRNWIHRQRREVARCLQILDNRQADVKAAEAKAMEARRAVRVLEKLRDRAWSEHNTRERRDEQKALDMLGVMQYAIRHMGDRT
jgi:flagellar export protein FliJ